MPEHFTGKAERLEGRLALRANGCVTVVVGGVERMPLWPDKTTIVQQPGNPARHVVTLASGTTIAVDDSTGDAFSAAGIVDDNTGPFETQPGLPTKISSLLGYCGVEASPVAFPDAATFAVDGAQEVQLHQHTLEDG